MKGREDDKKTRTSLLRGKGARIGTVQPGEKMAQRGSYINKYLK